MLLLIHERASFRVIHAGSVVIMNNELKIYRPWARVDFRCTPAHQPIAHGSEVCVSCLQLQRGIELQVAQPEISIKVGDDL